MGKITINMDALKSSRDWVRHKVNDGSNIFRILPPFGDPEVHNNFPYRRWSIAWLQDPKSGKRKPFATPATEGGEDPIQEYADALKKFIDHKAHELKSQGYSDEDIKSELEGLRGVQWEMRTQHLYAYNAADQANSVGLLELKSTAHKAMKKAMNQYIKDQGQDPTSLNSEEDDSGVWFNVSKEGKGMNTEYSVAVNQIRQKMNGQVVKLDDRSALTEHVVENYESLGYDLNSIYVRKDYDELRELLLYNLAIIAQEVPEAVLEGYDISDVSMASAKPTSATKKASEDAPVAKKAVAKPKVQLNLGNDDDEEEQPVRKSTPSKAQEVRAPLAKKQAPASQSFDDDELSALTAEILGD